MAFHWLISALPPETPNPPADYYEASEYEEHPVFGPLLQYPYLKGLGADWLMQHDERGIARVEEFLTMHANQVAAEPAAHDLSVWLLDQVVLTMPNARWVFHPRNTCAVEVGPVLLDPYRTVLERLRKRRPFAHELLDFAKTLTGE
jgi:hypothetical protein